MLMVSRPPVPAHPLTGLEVDPRDVLRVILQGDRPLDTERALRDTVAVLSRSLLVAFDEIDALKERLAGSGAPATRATKKKIVRRRKKSGSKNIENRFSGMDYVPQEGSLAHQIMDITTNEGGAWSSSELADEINAREGGVRANANRCANICRGLTMRGLLRREADKGGHHGAFRWSAA